MGYKPLGSSHHDNNNNNLDFINHTQHHCAIQQQMVKVPNVVNRNLIWFMLAVATGRNVLSVGWRITSDNIKKYS